MFFSIAARRRIELTRCVWDRVLLIGAFLDVTNVSGQGLYSPSFFLRQAVPLLGCMYK